LLAEEPSALFPLPQPTVRIKAAEPDTPSAFIVPEFATYLVQALSFQATTSLSLKPPSDVVFLFNVFQSEILLEPQGNQTSQQRQGASSLTPKNPTKISLSYPGNIASAPSLYPSGSILQSSNGSKRGFFSEALLGKPCKASVVNSNSAERRT